MNDQKHPKHVPAPNLFSGELDSNFARDDKFVEVTPLLKWDLSYVTKLFW